MHRLAMFPGQGSQIPGMGKKLAQNFKVAKQTFEEASDALGFHLGRWCFEGSKEELSQTEVAQPSLLTVSIAAFRVAEEEMGYEPTVVAGHSLGEYSALVACGALSFVDALQWVRARGLAMSEVKTGGMAAILGMEDEALESLLVETRALHPQKVLEAANWNAPGQVVVSGHQEMLEALKVFFAKKKPGFERVRFLPLNVSGPFHSSLMEEARVKMEIYFNPEKVGPIRTPYIPNRSAVFEQDSKRVVPLLLEQMDHDVLWSQSMKHVLSEGVRYACEFGPGQVLSGLLRRVAGKEAHLGFAHVHEPEDLRSLEL